MSRTVPPEIHWNLRIIEKPSGFLEVCIRRDDGGPFGIAGYPADNRNGTGGQAVPPEEVPPLEEYDPGADFLQSIRVNSSADNFTSVTIPLQFHLGPTGAPLVVSLYDESTAQRVVPSRRTSSQVTDIVIFG